MNPAFGFFRRGHHQVPPADPTPLPQPAPAPEPLPNLPAIYLKDITPLPQTDSPLYSRIPAEIRSQITTYYFEEQVSSAIEDQYPPDTVYTRPGYRAKKKVDTALLRTCRRMYLETCFAPAQKKEFVFWHSPERSPDPRDYPGYGIHAEQDFFARMPTWQWSEVNTVHLFTQLFWLERGDCFGELVKQDFMANVEELTITVRRGDWWWNESDAALVLNPYTGDGQAANSFTPFVERVLRGEKPEFREGSWAHFFGQLPNLKKLVLELETKDHKKDDLETLVKMAKTWAFPMGEGKVLKAEEEVKSADWRCGMSAWDQRRCTYCGSWGAQCERAAVANSDPRCTMRSDLMRMGLGPMLLVRQIAYVLEANGRSKVPPKSAGDAEGEFDPEEGSVAPGHHSPRH